MSMFGQVVPFRARRESAPAPVRRVHRSLNAALAEAGLAEPPSLSQLSVEPEAGVLADTLFAADERIVAEEQRLPSAPSNQAAAVAEARFPPSEQFSVQEPVRHVASPAPVAPAEPPLPRVLALASRHPPSLGSYPWLKSKRKTRLRTRFSDLASWLVTLAIMGGMIGVAATYLAGPRSSLEPVAQR